MTIYTVKAGDTLYSVSRTFGVPAGLLAIWNTVPEPYTLVTGQSLLVLTPTALYTVREGDTYASVSARTGVEMRRLFAMNPQAYGGTAPLYAGQSLVLAFAEEPAARADFNGYAYPFIEERILRYAVPYIDALIPFTYGFTPAGALVPLDDERLIAAAREGGAAALMHLSTLTENGNFSSERAAELFGNPAAMDTLARNVLAEIEEKGYAGLDIDFEFIPAETAGAYADFIARLRTLLNPQGYTVIAALAPKTRAEQPGLLYEGHDYAAVGAAADAVLLMTYEWGYTYGPPMAVAPISAVRSVLDYAVSVIPREKIYMGLPNYAYDWTLPYKQGYSRATSIGNDEAVDIARRFGAEIKFDESSQTPYFAYYDGGIQHEVWFEDARSMQAKFGLIREYGFAGGGYWNMMRPFTPGFLLQFLTFD
ncbi:MAG: LysM peptidoglycan-binding domain-containing protein [Clostridia bacterium]|nr:LysM peptidoglycan-binding domain-containing protein [Clostridia bacterium]